MNESHIANTDHDPSNRRVGTVVDSMPPQATPQAETRRSETKEILLGTFHHGSLLVISIVVMLASFALSTTAGGRITLPGSGVPLPSICLFRNVTGIDCPGCGLTRGFVNLARGDFATAWSLNPAGFLMFILIAVQIPYRSWQLWRNSQGQADWRMPQVTGLIVGIVVSALIGQWLIKLAQLFAT